MDVGTAAEVYDAAVLLLTVCGQLVCNGWRGTDSYSGKTTTHDVSNFTSRVTFSVRAGFADLITNTEGDGSDSSISMA